MAGAMIQAEAKHFLRGGDGRWRFGTKKKILLFFG
jgi:hypothetical protein